MMSMRLTLAITSAAFVLSAAVVFGEEGPSPTTSPAHDRGLGADVGPRRGPSEGLSKEAEQDALNMLKEHWPEQYDQLLKLKETSPESYRWMLQRMWRRMQRMRGMPRELQDAFVQLQKIRMRIMGLQGSILRAASEADRQGLKKQLGTAVEEEFAGEQTVLEYRLKELEKQVKRIRESLQDRA